MKYKDYFRQKIKEYKNDPVFLLEGILLSLNEEIIKLMKDKGLTQKAFAEKLGVSPAYVSKLLNGNPNLTIKSLVKITSVLNAKLEIKIVKENPKDIHRMIDVKKIFRRRVDGEDEKISASVA